MVGQVEMESTYAKFSKSRSIPSKLFCITKARIALTIFVLDVGLARRLERTSCELFPVFGSTAVPSVIVGRILKPAACIDCKGVAMGVLGLAGVYKSAILF